MRSSNRTRHHHHHPSRQGLLSAVTTITSRRPRMPSMFNTIRVCIYVAVLSFTIVCLAMAGQFQHVLAASDLTRFVPFAIFVCSASLFIVVTLLGCSFILKERNPISTRIELACLGLAGTFWLVLGAYLTTSESQSAEVECFSSETDTTPLDQSLASFHTDQYRAMFRVLMAFSLVNAALLLISFAVLLVLALRRHYTGDEHMWYGPVTSCAWFKSYRSPGLPGPGKEISGYREKPQPRRPSRHSTNPRSPPRAAPGPIRGRTR